jgi:hypothetical protein
MPTLNKQACPTCGQSVNEHEIPVSMSMVKTLFAIYQYCKQTGKHEFRRKEIDHLIPKGHVYGNFGYWKWFGAGIVYSPDGRGKGHWGFNLERIEEFVAGKRQIYARVWKNPLKPKGDQITLGELVYIHEIPSIQAFLDANYDFIVEYKGKVKFNEDGQGTLL